MTRDRDSKGVGRSARVRAPWILIGVLGIVVGASAQETWDGGAGSVEDACRAKVDETGAFEYSRAEVKGEVAHCYVKAKDGTGGDVYATAVLRDEPAPAAPPPD